MCKKYFAVMQKNTTKNKLMTNKNERILNYNIYKKMYSIYVVLLQATDFLYVLKCWLEK